MTTKQVPFVHLFKTYKQSYVYDVNTNAILKVNSDVYKNIETHINTGELKYSNSHTRSIIESLKDQGYLSTHRWKKIVHPELDLLNYYLGSSLKTLTLQVTQSCNLRCKYCTYSGSFANREHSGKRMSYDTAKKAVDFYISRSTDTEKLNFGFYGGEPLLEFELIQEIVNYIEKTYEGKEISYNLTTNATLLNEKIIDFLYKHNVSVTISMDGPKEIHDKNRQQIDCSGSFDTVMNNIKIIVDKYPKLKNKVMFNCVLDPTNDFGCVNEFFSNYGDMREFYTNFSGLAKEYIIDDIFNSTEEYRQSYQYEIFKMMLSKINKLDNRYVSKIVDSYYQNLKTTMINNRIVAFRKAENGHHGGPCIAGTHKLFVNTEGYFYPCEKVSECSEIMQIGHVDKGFDINKIKDLVNIGTITEEQCKNCWANKFCYLCALFADDIKHFSKEKKLFYCKQVRETIEDQIKDYCLLKEMKFNDNDIYVL